MTEPAAAPALAVLEYGITFDAEEVAYPTVVLDVTGRPDVADLARVHAMEGIGDLHTLLEPVPGGLTLHVQLARPVRAGFTVALRLPEHRPLLDLAAATGHLLLATTTPEAIGADPLWLAVDLDGERLAALVEQLDTGRLDRPPGGSA